MREIKFRARRAELPRDWEYGYFAIKNDVCLIINDNGEHKVIAGTECESTGLRDRNGKEIYEGDILGGFWEQCYIAWCGSCKALQVFSIWVGSHRCCLACCGLVRWAELVRNDGRLEVIGNIYENYLNDRAQVPKNERRRHK